MLIHCKKLTNHKLSIHIKGVYKILKYNFLIKIIID